MNVGFIENDNELHILNHRITAKTYPLRVETTSTPAPTPSAGRRSTTEEMRRRTVRRSIAASASVRLNDGICNNRKVVIIIFLNYLKLIYDLNKLIPSYYCTVPASYAVVMTRHARKTPRSCAKANHKGLRCRRQRRSRHCKNSRIRPESRPALPILLSH